MRPPPGLEYETTFAERIEGPLRTHQRLSPAPPDLR